MALALLCAACTGDKWSAIAYPDAGNLSKSQYLGEFDSLEGCRDAVRQWRSGLPNAEETDYECGKNCDSKPGGDIPVMCEATEE